MKITLKWAVWIIASTASLFAVACVGTGDDTAVGDSGAGDAGTDTDTDTDSDSDGDSDADAGADTDDGADAAVIDMDCSSCAAEGETLANMVCAFDICDSEILIENSYLSLTATDSDTCGLEDTYEAVARFGSAANDLAPKKNSSYALIATGYATGTSHSDQCTGGAVSDPWAQSETAETHDVMEWHVMLKAPEDAKAFRFKYVFFSEEYDEYISSDYNDKFYVFIEASSTNGAVPTLINFTECRAPDTYYDFVCEADDTSCEEGEKYCFIAINSAFSDCCWYGGCPGFDPLTRTDVAGTGFECAASQSDDSASSGSSTGWLQTSWPIVGGETFALTFHIHDTSDGVFDSEVILDAFEFLKDPDQGTIPID